MTATQIPHIGVILGSTREGRYGEKPANWIHGIADKRTTLAVLNAQQALVNARVALVTAQHDRVVASYAVLNAIGRLSPPVLGLPTTIYDPTGHYNHVPDSGPRFEPR